MAWTLDGVYVRVYPINPDLTYARHGATHMLTVFMEAHSSGSTLVSSVPLPVRVGESISLPKNQMGLRDMVYGWNGSVDAPTITPDVDDAGRGAACFSLRDGVLTPLPSNREALLTGPVRLGIGPGSARSDG
jgi:hypothetical protein